MSVVDRHQFRVVAGRVLGTVVVSVSGELDAATAGELRTMLLDLIEGQGNLSVVLDLRDLTFIDSTGLGVVVGGHKRLRQRGGELRLSAPRPSVAKVLEISGLTDLLTVTKT